MRKTVVLAVFLIVNVFANDRMKFYNPSFSFGELNKNNNSSIDGVTSSSATGEFQKAYYENYCQAASYCLYLQSTKEL